MFLVLDFNLYCVEIAKSNGYSNTTRRQPRGRAHHVAEKEVDPERYYNSHFRPNLLEIRLTL